MSMKHYLTISYNESYPKDPVFYTETIVEDNNEIIDEKELKRKPRQRRFDAVLENGSGHVNMWNNHRSKRIYGHHLEKSK
jgi:hypothetical protein